MAAWTMVRTDGSSSTSSTSRDDWSGGAEVWRESPIRLVEALGKDLGVGDHGHEVGVAVPARHDVDVQVVGDTRAGDPAEVQADVEGVRGVHRAQDGHAALGGRHQL